MLKPSASGPQLTIHRYLRPGCDKPVRRMNHFTATRQQLVSVPIATHTIVFFTHPIISKDDARSIDIGQHDGRTRRHGLPGKGREKYKEEECENEERKRTRNISCEPCTSLCTVVLHVLHMSSCEPSLLMMNCLCRAYSESIFRVFFFTLLLFGLFHFLRLELCQQEFVYSIV